MESQIRAFRVALETLGCKFNQAESEQLTRELATAGFSLVAASEPFDIYVLNSCTVTHVADRKARQCLRGAQKRNPEALVVALGCGVHTIKEAFLRSGAALVLDNSQKSGLVASLAAAGFAPGEPSAGASPRKVRSMVAVQNGCDRRCTYCVVPLVRGRERSREPEDIIATVAARVADGYREVALTGTEVGSYLGGQTDLAGLIRRILEATGIERLRISSLQPQEISPALLDLWHDRRLCPHFHLALQSGSDSVLSRMRRGYDTAAYRNALTAIRRRLPQAGITTDVIAGFPAETLSEFEDSLDFVREMGFARIHVFPYSKREGTAAAAMAGQVDELEKKRRTRILLAEAAAAARAFRCQLIDQPLAVLWESGAGGGVYCGYSGNYVRVYTRHPKSPVNSITTVVPERIYRDGLWARTVVSV